MRKDHINMERGIEMKRERRKMKVNFINYEDYLAKGGVPFRSCICNNEEPDWDYDEEEEDYDEYDYEDRYIERLEVDIPPKFKKMRKIRDKVNEIVDFINDSY